MPLQDAINFIKKAAIDNELRNSLYPLKQDEIFPELEKLGYRFSFNEFEESITMLHVQCQTEEEATHLFEVVWWFKMLYN